MRRRITPLSINRMLPSVLTLLALCAGMTAIRFAINGKFQYAVFTLIAAGIFDGLDGRLARLLNATSRFGAELDSLSDFISFGVAPAALLYLWTMAQWHSLGWAIVLFYTVCCALRLARFNTELSAEPPPAWRANFFSGAPAPAGAGLLMLPMFFGFEWGDWIARSPYLNGIWITGIALLMVSTVPTVSLKRIRIPHHFVVPTLLGIGVVTAFFTTAPWPTLIGIAAVYLGSIPLTVHASRQLRRASAAAAGEPAARAPTVPPTSLPAMPRRPQPRDIAPPPGEWRH
ncbi:MAG TPA: CDP-diacylglycerol--serine O-phosphatidyltransferase [Stellaceae bacterium]|nr:CDP-diacylglycerol--serine O-phosphatidyltransferase [Stellaceae bacterium]